jgi:hypothetical protein
MVARNKDLPYIEPMTIDEQHQALKRLSSLRRKPVVIEVPGNTIGSGITMLIGEGYDEFRRRWGAKFRGSIIGRSRTAWQMHVCRLPVFPYEHSDKGRKIVPRHLLRTSDTSVIVKWFRGLTPSQKWELCAESRSARTSDQNSRRVVSR